MGKPAGWFPSYNMFYKVQPQFDKGWCFFERNETRSACLYTIQDLKFETNTSTTS